MVAFARLLADDEAEDDADDEAAAEEAALEADDEEDDEAEDVAEDEEAAAWEVDVGAAELEEAGVATAC